MNELTTLAVKINEQHRRAEKAARTAIDHALKAGELLIQAKQDLPHGQFMQWVQSNCEFSDRSARGYMRLARELPELEESKRQHIATLPLREALKALGEPTELEKAEAVKAEIKEELDRAERDMREMDQEAAAGTLDNMAAIKRLAEIIPYAEQAEQTLKQIRLKAEKEAARLYKQVYGISPRKVPRG